MTDYDRFIDALLHSGDYPNPDRFLVLADWLEEDSKDVEMGFTYRWCGENGYFPGASVPVFDAYSHYFWCLENTEANWARESPHAGLPRPVMSAIAWWNSSVYRGYSDFHSAMESLNLGLMDLLHILGKYDDLFR